MSNDGSTWVDAFCGKYFAANDDRNSKAKIIFPKPISARLVRIYPVAWCLAPPPRPPHLVFSAHLATYCCASLTLILTRVGLLPGGAPCPCGRR